MKALLWILLALAPGHATQGTLDARAHRDLDGLGIPKSDSKFKYNQVTPNGIKVRSVDRVPDDSLRAIDEGIGIQLVKTRVARPYWSRYNKISDYRVYFVQPSTFQATDRKGQKCTNLETEPGSPCLLVKGEQTAGTTIGAQPFQASKESYIVLPSQAAMGWKYRDYLVQSARNESEHVREWNNDYDTWKQFIGPNDAHPHWP